MKNRTLFTLWGTMFALCAALGFIPQPDGLLKALLVLSAAVFFVPPVVLTARAVKQRDPGLLGRMSLLCALSLGLTLLFLILNFLSITAPQWLGDLLYGILVIVSAPMVCSRFWVGSLFIWACLLTVSVSLGKKLR